MLSYRLWYWHCVSTGLVPIINQGFEEMGFMKKMSSFFVGLAVAVIMLANINIAIAGDIKLLTPIGGERLKVGDTLQIHWTPTSDMIHLLIYNSNVFGGDSIRYIQEKLIDASSGNFDWRIDASMLPSGIDLDGGSYQILIDGANGEPLDSSFAFSITRK